MDAWTAFANKILAGEVTGAGRELLVTGRLTMISRGSGNGFHPICMDCCAYRAIGVTSVVAARARLPSMQPLQFGGGIRNGAEIVARADALAYDQGKAILSIDIKNAFNTTRLSIIYDGLLQADPSLLHYFRWRYGNPSILCDNTGATVATTRTGVRQGDPWGSLLFEVAIRPSLQARLTQLEEEHNAEHPHDNIQSPGSVAAFEDDTQARSDPRIIFQLAPLIKDIFAIDGFIVNESKCKITGAGITALPNDAPHGFEIQESGTTALGFPIGNEQFRTATTRSKMEAMAPLLAALRLLTPRSAILLLSQCICHRPGFLLRRASDLALVMPFARTFDEKICLAVEDTLRMDRHDGARARIFLPRHLAGMGIVRNAGMASEKGRLISRLALTEFLGQFYPNELTNLQLQHNFWLDIQLGQEEDLGHLTDIPTSTIAAMTFRSSKAILALGKRTADTIALTALADNGQLQTAANLLSYSASNFSFRFSTTGID